MMKWTRNMLLMPVLMVQAFSSCSLIDEPESDDNSPVKASLAFTVSSTAGAITRMSDEVLQIDQPFRGIQDVIVIPFSVSDTDNGVQSTDRPNAFLVRGVAQNDYEKTSSRFYYYDKCSFMRGTNAVLFYGRAIPVEGKANNGSLVANYPADMVPANISFSLEQMYSATEDLSRAQAVARYMTTIARATGWSTTTDSNLRAIYLNFTGQGNQGNAVLAGSSTSVTAYVNALKTEIGNLSDSDISDIKTAILAAIGTPSLNPYPVANTLPDGAAALRWDSEAMVDGIKGAFVPQTITTTEAAINSITRFTYPAELYYFGNSQLYTSNEEVAKTIYNSATSTSEKTAWENVLSSYPGRSPVSGNTQAVAMENPVQYAVARLQMTLDESDDKTLEDGKGGSVTYKQTTMPLTGVIIGGQHTVGYNFKPTVKYNPTDPGSTDLDLSFIYDSQVSGLTTNTLVLQSPDNEPVTVILEFENKTEQAFVGKDGIIYPNTKFYLIGQKLDPKDKSTDDIIKDRVFTQDHTTMVTMKFNNNALGSAYNVMPDLLSPRLEVGVQLVDKWIQTEPTSVQLD